MKICLVSQEYPPETARGGIGSQTWNKARTLTAMGHTVFVVSASGRNDVETRAETHDGVFVRRIPTPGTAFLVYENPTYWVGYSWEVFRELRRLEREVHFDVIDFAEYGAEGFAYMLDRNDWNRVPTVVQLHGPLSMFAARIGWPEKDSDFSRVGSCMEQYCIQRADALMACSANIADFTAKRHGVARDSIAVVHCGVDAEAFVGGRHRAERPTILFVGEIAINKGVVTVFEAALRLRVRHPKLLLQILGKGADELVSDFRQRAAAAGAADNVEFVGFVGREQLPDFFRKAWVFASPAQHEVGVANVYIEAMASACPVVAAISGAAKEAVEDGISGILVAPGDVEATTAALDRILGSEKLRSAMGQQGRRRVEEYFAMDHYINRVLETYECAIRVAREKLPRVSDQREIE